MGFYTSVNSFAMCTSSSGEPNLFFFFSSSPLSSALKLGRCTNPRFRHQVRWKLARPEAIRGFSASPFGRFKCTSAGLRHARDRVRGTADVARLANSPPPFGCRHRNDNHRQQKYEITARVTQRLDIWRDTPDRKQLNRFKPLCLFIKYNILVTCGGYTTMDSVHLAPSSSLGSGKEHTERPR